MEKHQCEQKADTEEALTENEFYLKDNLNAIQFCMNRALPGASVAFVEKKAALQMQTMEHMLLHCLFCH